MDGCRLDDWLRRLGAGLASPSDVRQSVLQAAGRLWQIRGDALVQTPRSIQSVRRFKMARHYLWRGLGRFVANEAGDLSRIVRIRFVPDPLPQQALQLGEPCVVARMALAD